MEAAPGALDADAQRRLMAQIIQLVHEAFGEDAQLAFTVMRHIVREDGRSGMAVYSMGTVGPALLAEMFTLAAEQMPTLQMRTLAIHEEPQTQQ